MNLTYFLLLGNDSCQRDLILTVKQPFQPMTHGQTQAALNLIMREKKRRSRIGHHLRVEGFGQINSMTNAELQYKATTLLTELLV